MRKIAERAWECYLFVAVYGFPWIVVESWPLAVVLLLPVLVSAWRDSTPVHPEIQFSPQPPPGPAVRPNDPLLGPLFQR